jgi:hypothetical protein
MLAAGIIDPKKVTRSIRKRSLGCWNDIDY